jgi:Dolichyl-phosphate-mannose-protein mannosyltransferase
MDHRLGTPRPPEPSPAATAAGVEAAADRNERDAKLEIRRDWPLLIILAVQSALSVRLLRADTAFQAEAAYLWAGHVEWAHILHGAPAPPYAYYFSGAPLIYPTIGALADSIGGLAAARLLSLVMMLAATVLLWAVAKRMFGRRAAVFAAALFAVLGATLQLGALADHDSLSVLLVALAVWCMVRPQPGDEATGSMVAAGVALALANATAYSSALLDPVVILVGVLYAWPASNSRLIRRRAGVVAVVLLTLILAGLLIGGGKYVTGINQTALAPAPGLQSAASVLNLSWSWVGVVFALAVCGIVASLMGRSERTQTWLLAVLGVAALVGPLNLARLHVGGMPDQDVCLGGWFAAIAAGYVVDKFIEAAPPGRMQAVTYGACVVALAFPASLGASQSRHLATSWPNSSDFIAIMRPLVAHTTGRLLVEDPSIAEYYLPAGADWERWSSTRNIILPSGASTGHPLESQGFIGPGNAATFARFIARGYFALVALNFADTVPLDQKIAADLRANPHYHVVEVIPYGKGPSGSAPGTYVVWRYEPSS